MLKHTLSVLQKKQPLTVAYFGGSITEGAGASDPEFCWRRRITHWFEENYPASEIREIHAAIGGTGSDLGMFRAPTDVLCHAPDLVFLEFAVNDDDRKSAFKTEETLVRQILAALPETDIVLIRTVTKSVYDRLNEGKRIAARDAYDRLAAYYGLDMVDIGAELTSRVQAGEGDFKTYTRDTVHPNDLGYTLYTNRIVSYLKEALRLPPALTDDQFLSARLDPARDLATTDFDRFDGSFSRVPGYIAASEKGKTLTYTFTGTTIGLYIKIASDSGDFSWSVDGSAPLRATTWDEYALQFDRSNYVILTDALPVGEHTLTVTVLGEKNERSKGTCIYISAFLVA